MIIGTGDIASALNNRDGFVFFAAGVSNSQCTDPKEFEREKSMLIDARLGNNGKMIVYFSSISIYLADTPYTRHKKNMQNLVREAFDNYTIIRLGNIDWGTNPNTFINFIRNKIKNEEQVEIRDEWKYMISKEQLLFVTDNLPYTGQHEISIFGDMKKVKDCL